MDIFRKKKKVDKLVEAKKDRRLLSHVPDVTNVRSNVDRRAHDPKSDNGRYEDYIFEQNAGIRYNTDFEVTLKTYSKENLRRTCTGTVVDISNTGMLFELKPDDFEVIKKASFLKARFTVTPGSMPEGNEMRVKQKVSMVRSFTTNDGKCMCAVTFTKHLHEYAAANKDRYMLSAASLFLAFSVGCIILMRAESVIYFKFNKLLYLYSLITAVFLLSRYIFGAFYRPKKIDPDFTPGVSILIPCFNEEEWIQRTIQSCVNQEYPIDKLEVIVIDDHSSDNSVAKIKEMIDKLKGESPEIYKLEDRLSYYVQPKNMGKREALVIGAERAKHELVVFVDSDSFLDPFAIRNIVQPFKDPKMGGVSGRTDVANTYTNALTKMQAVRYYVAFRVMKAAEGLFDAVSCLSGPLSCYRKSIILDNKDAWLNQRFLGQKATFGDDRSMTNFILRHHRATYQDTAICQTIVPNNNKVFLRQQMRWKRSWLRETLIAAGFMWKKEPFAAVTFYMGMIVPIAAPVVVLYNLVYVPLTQHIFPTAFLLGIFLMSLLMSMAQLFLRKSSTWFYGMLFCIYYEAVLLWQMPIAWFTFWKSTWGTRMTPDDVKAAERKLKRRLLGRKKNITPSEFASFLGISEAAVIAEMDGGKFEQYVEEVNGVKLIRTTALKDFYDTETSKLSNGNDQTESGINENLNSAEEAVVSETVSAAEEAVASDTVSAAEEAVASETVSAAEEATVSETVEATEEMDASDTLEITETEETVVGDAIGAASRDETDVITENTALDHVEETKEETPEEVVKVSEEFISVNEEQLKARENTESRHAALSVAASVATVTTMASGQKSFASFSSEEKKDSEIKPVLISKSVLSQSNEDVVVNYRIKVLEEKIDALIQKHNEEKEYLLNEISVRDDLLKRRDDQIDCLIRNIEIANNNTSKIIDKLLSVN